MESWIDAQWTKERLNEAAGMFDCDASDARKLGDFENYVYEVKKEEAPFILRITHSSHRRQIELEAEMKWINFLHGHGLNVSLSHQSLTGNLVEELAGDDGSFFISLFDKAPGIAVKAKSDHFDEKLFEKWGSLTGKMHTITKHYRDPSSKARMAWDEDDILNFERYLPQEEEDIIELGKQTIDEIRTFPQSEDTYGLIHSDIHHGNFFYDQREGDLHVFDFDDSMWFYFASDIAIPLYYATWSKHGDDSLHVRSAFGEGFLRAFLRGYESECPVSKEWFLRIPQFLLLRDLTLYSVFHQKWDLATIPQGEKELLDGLKKRLRQKEPMVDLNWEAIYDNR
ncbi:Ser/Thr protein kinase RdoA (MazF antagonist) [Rossellomorea marisflavi]